jgi:tRNA uridine 5-carboxymethylaminomethyl modification enzyme
MVPECCCGAAVLTTGTFLRGVIHIGDWSTPGRTGRRGAHDRPRAHAGAAEPADGPPEDRDAAQAGSGDDRLAGTGEDPGDAVPEPFSTLTSRIPSPQLACRVTSTTPATHAIIRENLHRSAIHVGNISGVGPRYCPSIEDKVKAVRRREIATTSSWSPRGWTIRPSIRTASPPRSPRTSSRLWSPPSRASSTRG